MIPVKKKTRKVATTGERSNIVFINKADSKVSLKVSVIDFNRLNWLINRQISCTIEYYRLIDYIFDDRFLSISYGLIFSNSGKRYYSTEIGQYKTWTADCGLPTTDGGLGIKYGLGIKCRLRTEYKTRTGYKTRTTDYVNKNSFRKVKLREMESGLAKQ